MILYKYTKVSKSLFGSLAKKTIWLSEASRFNDIFDCKFKEEDLSLAEFKELRKITEHRNSCGDDEDFEFLKKDVNNDDELSKVNAAELISIRKFFSRFGIHCMSEIKDSLLMWAHYADNHRGVCLEYEVDADRIHCIPINYSTQYPEISIYDMHTRLFKTAKTVLGTKSMEWAYEKEWRYIAGKSANKEIPRPFKLTGIIFGARCPKEDMESVVAIVKNEPLQFLKAIESSESFTLNIDSV